MVGERPAEPGVAHAQAAGEVLQVQRVLRGVGHAAHRLVDGPGDALAAVLPGLLGRVEQGQYVQGRSRPELLEGGSAGVDGVDHRAEGAEEQVLVPHPQEGPLGGEEAVAHEAPDHGAVAAHPVLAPSGP